MATLLFETLAAASVAGQISAKRGFQWAAVFVPPNVGKTHLAIALSRAAPDATKAAACRSSVTGWVGEWGSFVGDPVVATTLLDRLLHPSQVVTIRGNSYSLREKRRSGLIEQPTLTSGRILRGRPAFRPPFERLPSATRKRGEFTYPGGSVFNLATDPVLDVVRIFWPNALSLSIRELPRRRSPVAGNS